MRPSHHPDGLMDRRGSILVLCLTSLLTLVFAGETQGYVGLSMSSVNDSIAAQYGLAAVKGVLVSAVAKNSPAERAGLYAGDVIMAIDGEDATNALLVLNTIRAHAGEELKIDVVRHGLPLTLEVVVGTRVVLDPVLSSCIQALNACTSLDVDSRLRKRIIELVRQSDPPTEVPEEAQLAFERATEAQNRATGVSGYEEATREYWNALRVAPWLGAAYYNIARLGEVRGRAELAAYCYKLYLVASPDAPDAAEVRSEIRTLEEALRGRKEPTAYGKRWSASLGTSTLGPSTYRKWQGSAYDWTYSRIKWCPGTHLALGLTSPLTSMPYGNSFVVDGGFLFAFEDNQSAACTAVRTDSLTGRSTNVPLAGNAFETNRISVDNPFRLGYRVVLSPVALEPYLGFSLWGAEYDLIRDTQMSNSALSGFELGVGGWPTLGGRLYVGSFYLQVESSIYSRPLLTFNVIPDNRIDYATNTRASFSPGLASRLSLSVGTTWR